MIRTERKEVDTNMLTTCSICVKVMKWFQTGCFVILICKCIMILFTITLCLRYSTISLKLKKRILLEEKKSLCGCSCIACCMERWELSWKSGDSAAMVRCWCSVLCFSYISQRSIHREGNGESCLCLFIFHCSWSLALC